MKNSMKDKENKVKLLFAVDNMAIGGVQRLLVDQINSMDPGVFETSLVTLLPEEDTSFLPQIGLAKENIRFFHFPTFFAVKSFLSFVGLVLWMRKKNFDVVCCNATLANMVEKCSLSLK